MISGSKTCIVEGCDNDYYERNENLQTMKKRLITNIFIRPKGTENRPHTLEVGRAKPLGGAMQAAAEQIYSFPIPFLENQKPFISPQPLLRRPPSSATYFTSIQRPEINGKGSGQEPREEHATHHRAGIAALFPSACVDSEAKSRACW